MLKGEDFGATKSIGYDHPGLIDERGSSPSEVFIIGRATRERHHLIAPETGSAHAGDAIFLELDRSNPDTRNIPEAGLYLHRYGPDSFAMAAPSGSGQVFVHLCEDKWMKKPMTVIPRETNLQAYAAQNGISEDWLRERCQSGQPEIVGFLQGLAYGYNKSKDAYEELPIASFLEP